VSGLASIVSAKKPKSWRVAVWSAIVGLLFFCPMAWIAHVAGANLYFRIGFLGLSFSATVAAVTWTMFIVRMASGAYADIGERAWKDQVW
jgi:hypothetical protein